MGDLPTRLLEMSLPADCSRRSRLLMTYVEVLLHVVCSLLYVPYVRGVECPDISGGSKLVTARG